MPIDKFEINQNSIYASVPEKDRVSNLGSYDDDDYPADYENEADNPDLEEN